MQICDPASVNLWTNDWSLCISCALTPIPQTSHNSAQKNTCTVSHRDDYHGDAMTIHPMMYTGDPHEALMRRTDVTSCGGQVTSCGLTSPTYY